MVTETAGDGQFWVQAGSPGPTSFGNWINVSLSDQGSGVDSPLPFMVCSDGSAADLEVDTEWFSNLVMPEKCDWGEKAG